MKGPPDLLLTCLSLKPFLITALPSEIYRFSQNLYIRFQRPLLNWGIKSITEIIKAV